MLRKTVVLSWIPTQDSIISKLKKIVVSSWIPNQDSIISKLKKVSGLEFDSCSRQVYDFKPNPMNDSGPELNSYPR